MKSLELNQMEIVNGGSCEVGVALGSAGYMLSTVGLIAAAASGPIGWLTIAVAFTAKTIAVASIVNACAD